MALASVLAMGICVATAGTGWAATPPSRNLAADTRFNVDPHSEAAHQALTDLINRDVVDAAAMAKLASWPEATWFSKGTPSQVNSQMGDLVHRAAAEHAVPVLVAYDIPLCDCSQ
jgi:endoglucanase